MPRRTDGCVARTLRVGGGHRRTARSGRRSGRRSTARMSCTSTATGCSPSWRCCWRAGAGKPVVLTLYGTEIWHYAPKRFGPDLFTRAYQAASAVTFYSERLLGRAGELGLTRRHMQTIYPPVGPQFAWHDDDRAGRGARSRSASRNRHLLVNVKRLHPLAGQRFLIEAMNEVIRTHPDTRLVICGTGALLDGAAGSGAVGRRRASRHVCRARRQCRRGALLRRRRSLRAAVAARGAADRRGRGARLRHAGRLRRQPRRPRAERRVRPRRGDRAAGAAAAARARDRRPSCWTSAGRPGRRATRSSGSSGRAASPAIPSALRGRDGEGARHDARPRARARRGGAGGASAAPSRWRSSTADRRRCTSTSTSRRRVASSPGSTPRSATRTPAGRSRGPAETLTIDLADLDRQVDWRLDVRVRGARAGGAPNPDLALLRRRRARAHPRDAASTTRTSRSRSRRGRRSGAGALDARLVDVRARTVRSAGARRDARRADARAEPRSSCRRGRRLPASRWRPPRSVRRWRCSG